MWPRWLAIVVGIMGVNWVWMLGIIAGSEWKAGRVWTAVVMGGLFFTTWAWLVGCRARFAQAHYRLAWVQNDPRVEGAGSRVWDYRYWRGWRDTQIAVAVAFCGWPAAMVGALSREVPLKWSSGDRVFAVAWVVAIIAMLVWSARKLSAGTREARQEIRRLEDG